MSSYFSKPRLMEADGLAVVDWPEGQTENAAIVLQNSEHGIKLYYFLRRIQIADIIDSLAASVGLDG